MHEPLLEEYRGYTKSLDHDYLVFVAATKWYMLKSFRSLLTIYGVTVMLLSLAATWFCHRYGYVADLPLTFLGSGIFFPISFGISWTFQRRERALMDMADLKSSAVALYQCHREWDYEEKQYQELMEDREKSKAPADSESEDTDGTSEERHIRERLAEKAKMRVEFNRHGPMANEMRALITSLFEEMKTYLKHDGGKRSLTRVYYLFDLISKKQDELRLRNKGITGLMSRPLQYQRFMMATFERLKVLHDYRTASTLRGYAYVFLTLAPIFISPSFALLAQDFGPWAGFGTAFFATLMFVTLANVQDFIEDPFSGFGVDTVNLDILHEINKHMF